MGVDELPTHGGSLRIYACHDGDGAKVTSERARELLERESSAGYGDLSTYASFSARVGELKRELLAFLIDLKGAGERIVGYGAPAKGNTLLNFCGVGTDFIDYTVDASPHKQGRFLPGTHIPIRPLEALRADRPDVVLILPWNLKDEIVEQHGYIREWGGRFALGAPEPSFVS